MAVYRAKRSAKKSRYKPQRLFFYLFKNIIVPAKFLPEYPPWYLPMGRWMKCKALPFADRKRV